MAAAIIFFFISRSRSIILNFCSSNFFSKRAVFLGVNPSSSRPSCPIDSMRVPLIPRSLKAVLREPSATLPSQLWTSSIVQSVIRPAGIGKFKKAFGRQAFQRLRQLIVIYAVSKLICQSACAHQLTSGERLSKLHRTALFRHHGWKMNDEPPNDSCRRVGTAITRACLILSSGFD